MSSKEEDIKPEAKEIASEEPTSEERSSGVTPVNPIPPTLLVIANLLPLLGVILYQWDAFTLLSIYWFEAIIVSFVGLIRILTARKSEHASVGKFGALGVFVPASIVLVYGFAFLLLFLLAGQKDAYPMEMLEELVSSSGALFWGCIVLLAVSRFVSLFVYFFMQRGRDRTTADREIWWPYKRYGAIVLAMIALGILCAAVGNPLWFVGAIVFVKLAIDLVFHVKEHKPGRPRRRRMGSQTIAISN